jgi:hypothetical protein
MLNPGILTDMPPARAMSCSTTLKWRPSFGSQESPKHPAARQRVANHDLKQKIGKLATLVDRKRSNYHMLTSDRILVSGQKSFSWAT